MLQDKYKIRVLSESADQAKRVFQSEIDAEKIYVVEENVYVVRLKHMEMLRDANIQPELLRVSSGQDGEDT